MTLSPRVPVYRPQLPSADEVVVYLRRCDAARYYTNRGPLVRELEGRLAGILDLPDYGVRTASSGTAALEIAILAHAGMATAERPLALIPSYTFAATALAAERCGYRPHFVDIDPVTWALDPAALARHPLIGQAGIVLPVAPYGRLPDVAGFEALQEATGARVIIDAAAAFEQVLDNPGVISATVPVMVSFHATKTFSSGEGGAVFWNDRAGQERVVQVANFGFHQSRECKIAGTNAKMSEYHAAVGLAMLDSFDARRRDYARVAGAYAARGARLNLPGRLHVAPDVSSAYVLFEAADRATMLALEAACTAADIETRRWYERGLHCQPHFAAKGRDAMAATEDVGGRLLGLPMAWDLPGEDIDLVLDTLAAADEVQPAAVPLS